MGADLVEKNDKMKDEPIRLTTKKDLDALACGDFKEKSVNNDFGNGPAEEAAAGPQTFDVDKAPSDLKSSTSKTLVQSVTESSDSEDATQKGSLSYAQIVASKRKTKKKRMDSIKKSRGKKQSTELLGAAEPNTKHDSNFTTSFEKYEFSDGCLINQKENIDPLMISPNKAGISTVVSNVSVSAPVVAVSSRSDPPHLNLLGHSPMKEIERAASSILEGFDIGQVEDPHIMSRRKYMPPLSISKIPELNLPSKMSIPSERMLPRESPLPLSAGPEPTKSAEQDINLNSQNTVTLTKSDNTNTSEKEKPICMIEEIAESSLNKAVRFSTTKDVVTIHVGEYKSSNPYANNGTTLQNVDKPGSSAQGAPPHNINNRAPRLSMDDRRKNIAARRAPISDSRTGVNFKNAPAMTPVIVESQANMDMLDSADAPKTFKNDVVITGTNVPTATKNETSEERRRRLIEERRKAVRTSTSLSKKVVKTEIIIADQKDSETLNIQFQGISSHTEVPTAVVPLKSQSADTVEDRRVRNASLIGVSINDSFKAPESLPAESTSVQEYNTKNAKYSDDKTPDPDDEIGPLCAPQKVMNEKHSVKDGCLTSGSRHKYCVNDDESQEESLNLGGMTLAEGARLGTLMLAVVQILQEVYASPTASEETWAGATDLGNFSALVSFLNQQNLSLPSLLLLTALHKYFR